MTFLEAFLTTVIVVIVGLAYCIARDFLRGG
jgi:hypothetical protein